MAIKITSPRASFIQFGELDIQPYKLQNNIPLPEQDRWNVGFQFSIIDDITGFLPTSQVVKVAICGYDDSVKVVLGNAIPLFTRTHILYDQDTINIVSIIVGTIETAFNRLITRKELIDFLYTMGIIAQDAGSYIWFKESTPVQLTIAYLDEDNVSRQLSFDKLLDIMFVDIDTEMTGAIAVGECYRYGLLNENDEVLATSNAFIRVTGERYLSLVRYRNNEDGMDFVYASSDMVYNRVSVPFYFETPQFSSSRKAYTKSTGETVLINSSMSQEWESITEWMPLWMHKAMAVAIEHDTFEVKRISGWQGLTVSADYKIEWAEDTADSGQATVKFRERIFDYQNDSIGNTLAGCLPPYVKLASATAEKATFILYPNINCHQYDFRFRQKDAEDWSMVIPIVIEGYAPYTYEMDLTPFPFTAFQYQFRSRCANGEISDWGYVKSFGTESCDPLYVISGGTLPSGRVGMVYSHILTLGGDPPFAITTPAKPDWMTVTLTGSQISFTGTPDSSGTVTVDFNISNCDDSQQIPFTASITISPAEEVPTGTIRLEIMGCDGGSVVIKNSSGATTTISTETCSIDEVMPYDTYQVISITYDPCASGGGFPQSIPSVGSVFVLSAGNPFQFINLICAS